MNVFCLPSLNNYFHFLCLKRRARNFSNIYMKEQKHFSQTTSHIRPFLRGFLRG